MLSYLQGAKQQEFRESQHVNYLMNESIIIRLLQKYSTTAPLGGLRGLRGDDFGDKNPTKNSVGVLKCKTCISKTHFFHLMTSKEKCK